MGEGQRLRQRIVDAQQRYGTVVFNLRQVATRCGFSKQRLHTVIHERRTLTPEMVLRIDTAIDSLLGEQVAS